MQEKISELYPVEFKTCAEGPPVEWLQSSEQVPYLKAVAFMEQRVEAIQKNEKAELVWLLEHPPLYTAGTSAQHEDLKHPGIFPVFPSGRGGQYTYHGPGQRVIYVLLDLRKRNKDVRAFIKALEYWVITCLKDFKVKGEIREERVGVWVEQRKHAMIEEKKIAAIGVRLKKWVSYHGIAINVAPNLEHFEGIVPCGLKNYGVTSLRDLGIFATMQEVDEALKKSFVPIFGCVQMHAEPFTEV